MTERLYYSDPYVREFERRPKSSSAHLTTAGLRSCSIERRSIRRLEGNRTTPVRSATCGLSDVVDRDDGSIVHVIDRGEVAGGRPWVMERSIGSGASITCSSTPGSTCCRPRSIAWWARGPRASIWALTTRRSTWGARSSAADVGRAEDEANRVVWANRSVTIRFADADEAARLPLRKESLREGVLRLIEVEDFDLSACGGTHVSRTGEIGIIAVGSTERFRGGSRIEFFCGGRALRSHRGLRDIVSASTKAASAGPAELPAAFERLQSEVKELKRTAKDLHSRLATHEADALASRAESIGPIRFTFAAIDGSDANSLKQIATAIVTRPGHAAVVLSAPPPAFVVVARSTDVSLDAGALLKRMLVRFGGKGGGTVRTLLRAAVWTGPAQEMLAHARTLASAP